MVKKKKRFCNCDTKSNYDFARKEMGDCNKSIRYSLLSNKCKKICRGKTAWWSNSKCKRPGDKSNYSACCNPPNQSVHRLKKASGRKSRHSARHNSLKQASVRLNNKSFHIAKLKKASARKSRRFKNIECPGNTLVEKMKCLYNTISPEHSNRKKLSNNIHRVENKTRRKSEIARKYYLNR